MFLIFSFIIVYLALGYTHFYFLLCLLVFTNIVVSASMTVLASNPINSIFFLIALFLNVSIACFYLNLVYIALILIIVYVGALSIFFLFTVMLLNVNTLLLLRKKSKIFFFLDLVMVICILGQIVLFVYNKALFAFEMNTVVNLRANFLSLNTFFFNLIDFYASLLYTIYGSVFVLLGFFLFIVMIGVILLIQEQKNLIKNSNNVTKQLFRNYKSTIFHYY